MSRHTLALDRAVFTPAPRTIKLGRIGLPISISTEGFAGIAAVALPMINVIGPLGVLVFAAGVGLVLVTRPLPSLREILRFSPLLLLPLLAMMSTMWSDAPQRSMRSGLELLLTIVAGIIICRNMRPERFILCIFSSLLLISLTIATVVPASISSGLPLYTWWGSKNQIGLVGFTLFALSLAIAFDRNQPWPARLISIPAALYALVVCHVSQSGGTTSSIVIMLLSFPPLALLAALKPPIRIALIIFTLLLVLIAAFFLNDISAAVVDFRTTVLNKDATLTGRTYLWDFADKLSAGRPILGYGYFAFWRQGNIDAEGLWRWGGIASRGGFNFHNAFVGMRVDLGLVGVTILAGSCVLVMLAALARQVIAPTTATACLIAITLVNYAKAYVEEGLVSPFSFVTVIWLAAVLYAVPAFSRRGVPGSAGLRDRESINPATMIRKEIWLSGAPRGKGARRMSG